MTWLARFLHFIGGTAWFGGYVMLVFALLPRLEAAAEHQQATVLKAIRVISLSGAWTIFSGLLLIAYSRGYASFGHGAWGGAVAGALVLAIALMGITDGLIRPAVRKLNPANLDGLRTARRWAIVSLIMGLIILATMAHLPYAGS